MTEILNILTDTLHRSFEIPSGQWKYYQEWNKALFLHWEVPFEVLRRCVPDYLNIDKFGGRCYVSLVAFTMQNIRPRYLPSLSYISDFHEINLRTYIDQDNKKGVYFLNIEAEKYISAFIAKSLSGLPYEKSHIQRTDKKYKSSNVIKNFFLDAEFVIKKELVQKSNLDSWLTERYCLYLDINNEMFRYDIHHKEWKINDVEIDRLNLNYKIGDICLSGQQPDLAHYSNGVKVLAWGRQKI